MSGLLASYGYRITDNQQDADLWVLNSCAVKNPSEDSFNNEITKAKEGGKKIVVAGCIPEGQPNGRMVKPLSIVGVQQIDRVVEVVEETLKGNTVRLTGVRKEDGKKAGGAHLNLPKIRRNQLVEVVPISTGCLNQCTYCKTKHARGDLGSYPPEQLVERVRTVIGEGVVEIWLTSEDTGAYGRDIDTDLPALLQQILDVMPDGTMLRLGMTNPPYIMEHIEAVGKLLQHPRMYSFLHVPVQAASDSILYAMAREYTQADFRKVVDGIQSSNPGATVATDIICGFPGETEEDFQETMALCREYKFPALYINQFFARPGTPAAAMEKVNTKEVKTRTKRLSELFKSYFPHEGKVGNVYRVLCAEESTDKKHYVSHNKNYDQILVPKREELLGKTFDVKVTEAGKFHMIGEVIEESVARAPTRPPPLAKGKTSAGNVPDQAVLRERRARRAAKATAARDGGAAPEATPTEEKLTKKEGLGYEWYVFGAVMLLLVLDLIRMGVRYLETTRKEVGTSQDEL
jgi:threonylcarbamoyladenosine tRNA methylthiotransferase CDKAL1